MTVILGIDPGSHVTGFGVVQVFETTSGPRCIHSSHGVIALPKNAALPERLKVLRQGMDQLLKKYQPHHVAIEQIFLGKSADSAFKLGHARGLVMADAACFGAEVHEYATRVIKRTVAGKGSADKEQVQASVCRFLGLKHIEHLDASDALALAIHHAQQLQVQQILRRQQCKRI